MTDPACMVAIAQMVGTGTSVTALKQDFLDLLVEMVGKFYQNYIYVHLLLWTLRLSRRHFSHIHFPKFQKIPNSIFFQNWGQVQVS